MPTSTISHFAQLTTTFHSLLCFSLASLRWYFSFIEDMTVKPFNVKAQHNIDDSSVISCMRRRFYVYQQSRCFRTKDYLYEKMFRTRSQGLFESWNGSLTQSQVSIAIRICTWYNVQVMKMVRIKCFSLFSALSSLDIHPFHRIALETRDMRMKWRKIKTKSDKRHESSSRIPYNVRTEENIIKMKKNMKFNLKRGEIKISNIAEATTETCHSHKEFDEKFFLEQFNSSVHIWSPSSFKLK